MSQAQLPWYRELSGYHWFVFVIATLGWMFDCLDQRLFVLARSRAMEELLEPCRAEIEQQVLEEFAAAATQEQSAGDDAQAVQTPQSTAEQQQVIVQRRFRAAVEFYSSIATAMLLVGWATGGLLFGVLGDRLGRAKTLMLTILTYSLFTGLSGISFRWWDFVLYRFLTGMGVGGAFAAAVSLVAEVMPPRARPHTLGLLQSFSALGNITGSLIGLLLLPVVVTAPEWLLGGHIAGWRLMFVVGFLPAVLVVIAMNRLKEPESWLAARAAAKAAAQSGQPAPQKLGSLAELLGDRRWRKHTIIGVLLVTAGAVGLWGVGFWSPELIRNHVLKDEPKQVQDAVSSVATALQDVGAFFGMLVFTFITAYIGRRGAFALCYLLCLVVVSMVFGFMSQKWQVYWMIPLLGFATLSVFGGFAIYLPELYPTRLRSTGTGFCYNVARYLTAIGVFTMGSLTVLYTWLFSKPSAERFFAFFGAEVPPPFRAATVTVAMIFLLGLAVLPFAPETKDKPLPE